MAISKEDVLEFISGLSVLELSELVKRIWRKNLEYLLNLLQVVGAEAAVEAVEEKLNLMLLS